MISILIPCFDYNAYPLVSVLEKQALMLKIDFEIICIDDGSFSTCLLYTSDAADDP